jgi:hypothetical protein
LAGAGAVVAVSPDVGSYTRGGARGWAGGFFSCVQGLASALYLHIIRIIRPYDSFIRLPVPSSGRRQRLPTPANYLYY